MASSGVVEIVLKIRIAKLGDIGHNLYVIKVPPDGSCFFHSILRAFHREYIETIDPEHRNVLVKKLRQSLSEALEETNEYTNTTEYDTLGNGYYRKYNEAIRSVDGDTHSLESLQKELKSNNPVDHSYIEILNNHLNIDIYLISSKTGDVYLTGTDRNLLYKNRKSIVLLYTPGHYDIIGIKRLNTIDGSVIFDTLFSCDHDLILSIKKRINYLSKE